MGTFPWSAVCSTTQVSPRPYHLSSLCCAPRGLASVPMTRFWELFCGWSWAAGCQHTPRFSGGPWRGTVCGAPHREICYRRGASWVEGLAALCPSGTVIVTGTRCECVPGGQRRVTSLPAWGGRGRAGPGRHRHCGQQGRT